MHTWSTCIHGQHGHRILYYNTQLSKKGETLAVLEDNY